jgi:hypothetical protein
VASRLQPYGLVDHKKSAGTSKLQRGEAAMATENEGIREWTGKIRAEFMEMPGLALTRRQFKRLWILDEPFCDAVLDALLESGFLRRRRDDTYCRADSGL